MKDSFDPESQETKEKDNEFSSLTTYDQKTEAKWLNNQGDEVEEVFGFNQNAELVNGRAAMFGFAMLLVTELVFRGQPVTRSIFGIG